MKTKNDYIDNSFTMMLQCQSCRSFVRFLRIDWSFPLPPFRHCFVIFFLSIFPRFPFALLSFFFYKSIFFSIYFFSSFFMGNSILFLFFTNYFFSQVFFFLIPILYSKILVIEPLQWPLISFYNPHINVFHKQNKHT